jgi:TPR repeat protein
MRPSSPAVCGLSLLSLALLALAGCRTKDATCEDPATCARECTSRNSSACFAAGYMYAVGIHTRREPERAVELFEQACNAGHSSACTYLASSYEHGVGVTADRARAQRLYESACNSRDGRACIGLGALIEVENPGLAQLMFERGRTHLRKACSDEPGVECAALGLVYVQGLGTEVDLLQGEKNYEAACRAGDVESCSVLAELVRGHDPAAADRYNGKACDGGYLYACVQLGVDLLLGTADTPDAVAGVARLSQACEAGEPRACGTLGTAYVSGVGVETDLRAAIELYERGCQAGDGYACGSLGLMYSLGSGVERDLDVAGKLFAKACEAGDALACGNLGWMHLRGIGFAQDREGGSALLGSACESGDGRSCYRLGLHEAEQGQVRESSRLWRAGCELGSADACTALSVSFIDGEIESGDQRLAIDLARYGCQEGSAAGCTLAGQIYALGWNTESNRATAEAYFRYACDLGDVDGCEVLATWLSDPEGTDAAQAAESTKLWTRGRDLRERSCEQGNSEDCVVLGAYYVRGLGVEKNFGRAVELYGKACDAGLHVACTQRAQILITGTSSSSSADTTADTTAYDEAFALLTSSCAAQDQLACAWLGLAYHRGRGVEADGSKAAEHYARGCEQGYSFGCIGMGKLHEQGFGVRKNRRTAKKFFAQACELGAESYCR